VRDALRELGGVADPDALSPEQQLEVIVDRVEPQLGRERPVFLTHFPLALASLARPAPDDPGASERFELFLGGLELGNGFGELTDAAEQRRRCQADNAERRALGLPELPLDEDFLGALAEGMPPSAGIAVGLDRVVMLLADAATIDEVLAF
jgi:lysyl-tRNA synthetase class 2